MAIKMDSSSTEPITTAVLFQSQLVGWPGVADEKLFQVRAMYDIS